MGVKITARFPTKSLKHPAKILPKNDPIDTQTEIIAAYYSMPISSIYLGNHNNKP